MTEGRNRKVELHFDADALGRCSADDIAALTDAATQSTYYRDGLTPEQLAAIRRIVDISAETCTKAAENQHQLLVGAFIDDKLGGFLISTCHAADNREIDWMMVHPSHHGLGVGAALMRTGIEWLDPSQPQWLNVVAHNDRAINFYRKYGFEIDGPLTPPKAIDQWIMRRPGGLPLS
ncbi:MAG TPA: GNAT family N-acetyltransferase [Pedomonas sp.]|uniref:GNAT family N-acetyltransferase n=1 Tax=Pedomonas sp. TaxID=2976421 RepID=UPI002F3FD58E